MTGLRIDFQLFFFRVFFFFSTTSSVASLLIREDFFFTTRVYLNGHDEYNECNTEQTITELPDTKMATLYVFWKPEGGKSGGLGLHIFMRNIHGVY